MRSLAILYIVGGPPHPESVGKLGRWFADNPRYMRLFGIVETWLWGSGWPGSHTKRKNPCGRGGEGSSAGASDPVAAGRQNEETRPLPYMGTGPSYKWTCSDTLNYVL